MSIVADSNDARYNVAENILRNCRGSIVAVSVVMGTIVAVSIVARSIFVMSIVGESLGVRPLVGVPLCSVHCC